MGMMPTATGVTLTPLRFYMLHDNMNHLIPKSTKDDLKPGRVHLGGNYFAIACADGSVLIRYACEEAIAVMEAQKKRKEARGIAPMFYFKLADEDEVFQPSNKRSKKELYADISYYDVGQCRQIRLTRDEMKKLMEVYEEIEGFCSDLKKCSPCMLNHENQLGFYSCRECCPFPLEYCDYQKVPYWLYSWKECNTFPLQSAFQNM